MCESEGRDCAFVMIGSYADAWINVRLKLDGVLWLIR